MKLLFLLCAFLVICSGQTIQPPSNCKVFCHLCQEGFGFMQKNIALLESITQNQLRGFIDHLCEIAPSIDIVKLVCDVAKNDFVEGIDKFLEFLKQNTDPLTVCHQLSAC
ncbi:hypothetical protein L3Y34_008570 [Caenorhabditis briggsae]|uniref:Saposin B-type domain-containing protein n=1 Tax=Caenorhabditis briggsae TaxID=6238 RepID=A0AAE9D1C1_CAEBR|nr:hypothetical protein L3Y34_008570 [Caenorhabditis briggsae]